MIINKKSVKKIAEQKGKKIGHAAISKLDEILEDLASKMIARASKQADFLGRKVIREEDFDKH